MNCQSYLSSAEFWWNLNCLPYSWMMCLVCCKLYLQRATYMDPTQWSISQWLRDKWRKLYLSLHKAYVVVTYRIVCLYVHTVQIESGITRILYISISNMDTSITNIVHTCIYSLVFLLSNFILYISTSVLFVFVVQIILV